VSLAWGAEQACRLRAKVTVTNWPRLLSPARLLRADAAASGRSVNHGDSLRGQVKVIVARHISAPGRARRIWGTGTAGVTATAGSNTPPPMARMLSICHRAGEYAAQTKARTKGVGSRRGRHSRKLQPAVSRRVSVGHRHTNLPLTRTVPSCSCSTSSISSVSTGGGSSSIRASG
jgi:hypothetical protein